MEMGNMQKDMKFTYIPYASLRNWDKNEKARTISTDNWEKLLLSVRKEGIKDAFSVDEHGTVYDGNNRLKALHQLIEVEKIVTAENGLDLQTVPCIVKNPQTEAQKWEIAFDNNGQFANWDQDGLSNYLPEFEDELDMSLFNIDFYEHQSMTDQLNEDSEKKDPSQTKEKEYECPNCGHMFAPTKTT